MNGPARLTAWASPFSVRSFRIHLRCTSARPRERCRSCVQLRKSRSLRPITSADDASGFSSINQEMNLFGQDAGNIPDDAPSQKVNQHVPLLFTEDQVRSSYGCGNLNDCIGRGIAHSVTREHGMPFRPTSRIRKNRTGLLVVYPFSLPVFRRENWLLTNEEHVKRSVGFFSLLHREIQSSSDASYCAQHRRA
jgi:hypothetical protein